MATAFTNILTDDEINQLTADPAVVAARTRLDTGSRDIVYTNATLPDSARSRLQDTLGLDLTSVKSVPMRWIRGDTPAHVDVGRATFENTYLVYMNDSTGSLIVDGTAYPITQGSAYRFNEGLRHETVGTGSEPRLLLGPMSEHAFPVGIPQYVFYYANEADALAQTNSIASTSDYTVISTGGYSSWRLASNSTGLSPKGVPYNEEEILVDVDESENPAYYYLYPAEIPAEDTCCKAALDLKGIDYQTRAQIIAGINTISGVQKKPMSYSDYMNMKKAINAKRK
jgi:hypothetical protein